VSGDVTTEASSSLHDTPLTLYCGRVITGTLVWYYYVCEREVWFMAREITPDEDDPALDMGRALHETHYKRFRREVPLDGIKIDVIRSRPKTICEVKTSSRYLKAAKMQLAYYLFRLELQGIKMDGEIRIPKERKQIKVILDRETKSELQRALKGIREVASLKVPPPARRRRYCSRCSYRDMCWV